MGSACNCCLFCVLSPESSGPYNCENSAWNSGAVNWPQDLSSSLCNSFVQAFREPSYWQRQWSFIGKDWLFFCNPANEMEQLHSFGPISVPEWQSTVCKRIRMEVQPVCSKVPWAASPSTRCGKFPSLFLSSAALHRNCSNLRAVLGGTTPEVWVWGEGACCPGLRLLGQAAAASFGFILTVSKCWSSLCRAGEDFLSGGTFYIY